MSDVKVVSVEEVGKTGVQLISEWIWWTVFLPITLPLATTKYFVAKATALTLLCISFSWSAFCVMTLVFAAIAVYVPYIGERLAWLCLLPSKIDSIPQQPFVRLAIDMLKLGA